MKIILAIIIIFCVLYIMFHEPFTVMGHEDKDGFHYD